MKNLGLKSFSVIIALFLFFYVHSQGNSSQRPIVVPVEIKNLPPDKIILFPSIGQVKLTVRGPSFLVSQLAASPPTVEVVLPPDVGNRYDVSFSESAIRVPPSVEIVSIEPSRAQLIFDARVVKNVRVNVPEIGALSENLKLIEIEAIPSEVEITGPETEVKSITTVETFPIDLRDITSNTEQELHIRVPWKYSKVNPGVVDVFVRVMSVTVERQFSSVPIEIRSKGTPEVILLPDKVNVEISGPKNLVKGLTKDDIIPYVRIEESVSDDTEIVVSVDLPKGASLVFVNPKSIKVIKESRISKGLSKNKEIKKK